MSAAANAAQVRPSKSRLHTSERPRQPPLNLMGRSSFLQIRRGPHRRSRTMTRSRGWCSRVRRGRLPETTPTSSRTSTSDQHRRVRRPRGRAGRPRAPDARPVVSIALIRGDGKPENGQRGSCLACDMS